jgi:hypothetical protein
MMKKKLILVPLLIILVLSLVVPVSAKAEPQATAALSFDTAEYTVGDPIQLTLSITHPAGYQVIPPQLESSWGEFLVHSQSMASTVNNSDGTETTSQVIDVRLFAPGTFTTPPLPITISDPSGQLSEVLAEPVSLTIATVLVEGDTELRDIKPQAELPYMNWLPWLAGLTVFTLIFSGAFVWWRRNRARLSRVWVDNRLPHEVALDELGRIEELDLPARGRFKEHYTLVSDTIRLYIEKVYQIPVLERTTGEIKASLKGSQVSHEVAGLLVNFLDESDLVKFSKFAPDVVSAEQLLSNGRLIVDMTRPVADESGAENDEKPSRGISSGPGIGPGGSQPAEVIA